MPGGLEQLSFTGTGMFGDWTQHNLQELTSLTQFQLWAQAAPWVPAPAL